MKRFFSLYLFLLSPAIFAVELTVDIEVPKIQAAEYHRPYVAIWIEDAQKQHIVTLEVWHDQLDWLPDMRSWWRRGGRDMDMPADGITGATKPPGKHQLVWKDDKQLLKAQKYTLYVEAAREVGGREKARLALDLTRQQNNTLTFDGKTELGKVTLTIKH